MIFIIPLHFDYLVIWVPIITLAIIAWFGFWLLDRIGKGEYSIEYALGLLGEKIYHELRVNLVRKQTPMAKVIDNPNAQ